MPKEKTQRQLLGCDLQVLLDAMVTPSPAKISLVPPEERALLAAASRGDESEVQRLLPGLKDHLATICNTSANTALHLAAREGHTDIVKLLVKEGAAKDAVNKNGETALMVATKYKHTDIVKLLVESGATLEAPAGGRTALMHAADNKALDVFTLLLERGANPYSVDDDGNTVAAYVATKKDFLEKLLDTGFEFRQCSESANAWALIWSDTECAKMMLDNGVDPNGQEHFEKWTALMYAAKDGNVDKFRLLLSRGANRDVENHRGKTVEDFVTHPDMISALIAGEGDVTHPPRRASLNRKSFGPSSRQPASQAATADATSAATKKVPPAPAAAAKKRAREHHPEQFAADHEEVAENHHDVAPDDSTITNHVRDDEEGEGGVVKGGVGETKEGVEGVTESDEPDAKKPRFSAPQLGAGVALFSGAAAYFLFNYPIT